MKRFLKSMFSKQAPAPVEFAEPVAPDTAFVAVGDIHGCDEELARLIAQIDRDCGDLPWIFVGDYVDRGPASAQVIARLRELQETRSNPVVCLRGNHEKMMRDFLDDPLGRGQRWVRFGGLDTLRSFGVDTGDSPPGDGDDLLELCDAMEDHMPDGLVAWIDALPLSWQSGNVVCVHAAMDPELSLDEQDDKTLLWGHKRFFEETRDDGTWVVHGHTIVPEPSDAGGRIAVDTGAYKTGRLTAAHISTGDIRFFSA